MSDSGQQRKSRTAGDAGRSISPDELAQLQKKFSEIKHSINNALAVMMALSEMSQRRPDYAEKLATNVLAKAPQIVSSLQEFTQALNEKAGITPEGMTGSTR
jgi:type VI protein secretion system component VasF